MPDVLLILLGHRPRARREGLGHLPMEFLARLVEADHRAGRVIRLRVQLQHVLHAMDELAVYALGQAPRLLLPRLEDTFLRTRRIVSSETASTTFNSTSRLASIRAL
jgi:hypothetical protein